MTTTELRKWQFNDAINRVVNVVSVLYQTICANGVRERATLQNNGTDLSLTAVCVSLLATTCMLR